MTNAVISLKNINVVVGGHTKIIDDLNLDIYQGDFISILGTNGAGKSTLFNTIAGNLAPQSGQILHNGQDITQHNAVQRTKMIARVFQDPKMGTAPRMTVSENLLLAEKRGEHRALRSRGLNKEKLVEYAAITAKMGNNLDQRLQTPTGSLSGGQRQALSFLMATRVKPELLLLDEHTAALDPKTSDQLMAATNQQILDNQLTALMITHNLEDALRYGNRLLILNAGKIVLDVNGSKKQALTEDQLLTYFTF
ncbi:ABC transporter ATP-binding protein [Convivina praedatoris]|uniref:Glycine betaine/carnitine/choline transport ATP-binding protein OpuCA n=1 Tax=Convivina praedatoris TaxID=2880963 RepID=A0ABM9D308_9LACO|nr:ATP-binding cassette domain-containing protein [Convivina sp. LMG 32447]CAH1855812.1 Glycine betaine/carnitine/choline transport ATP-binding protein OpuCA [Convivina sp. LMG 32447]CAH1856690.1 Glycine betaine/carnitine/choline transport ATP-binding protein OpuCA [Convivina sp. LMG 32447]CAH1856804.1 Glycine betaine/carnitine/choline transport ATP-binding protein OpuCA [Convivina sp. LMG 32447]